MSAETVAINKGYQRRAPDAHSLFPRALNYQHGILLAGLGIIRTVAATLAAAR